MKHLTDQIAELEALCADLRDRRIKYKISPSDASQLGRAEVQAQQAMAKMIADLVRETSGQGAATPEEVEANAASFLRSRGWTIVAPS